VGSGNGQIADADVVFRIAPDGDCVFFGLDLVDEFAVQFELYSHRGFLLCERPFQRWRREMELSIDLRISDL
jgi:hypothetical protein